VTRRESSGQRQDARRNRDRLVEAAIVVVHRDGPQAPLAKVADEAGVGIGTLYRHFRTRQELHDHLTHRSFLRVLDNAVRAEEIPGSAIDSLREFIDAAIAQRNELVLPLHGGPTVTASATLVVRDHVHEVVQRVIDRGIAEGSVRPGATAGDIVVFGSLLAQPRPVASAQWDRLCRRLLTTYLRGLEL
jgi:AcrR family transcriptional regulator